MTPEEKYSGYVAKSDGQIYSLKRGKKLRQFVYGKYFHVTLCINGKRIHKAVHRMIAELLIPNPENKPEVNHMDRNKFNNRVDNLEWSTRIENTTHALLDGYHFTPKINRPDLSKTVIQHSMNGEFIAIYPSANEAARVTGLSPKWISECANGGGYRKSGGVKKWVNCNSSGGYKWQWQKVKESIQKL